MAVYYKYKSEKESFSVPVSESYISVSDLKHLIMKTSRYGLGRSRGRGVREDIALSHAQTGEEYVDGSTLIPQNSTVLIRRVAGRPCETIIAFSSRKVIEDGAMAPKMLVVTESASKSSTLMEDEDEEAAAIRAVIDASELRWDNPSTERGHAGGRFMSGHRFGRGPLEGETPPPGYVCRRCQVPGHFIQHCPTNGDPHFDFKRMTRSCVPTVSASVVDDLPAELIPAVSTSVVDDLPPELHCRLCKKVMTDAMLTSKCCFDSFCDKCIRDYIITQSRCICGVKTLADDLIPNQTLRSTITNMLATRASSASSSTGKPRSSFGSNSDPRSQSHTLSAASKEDMKQSMVNVSSVIPEEVPLVVVENNQLKQSQEKCTTNDDLKCKTEGNSARVPAQKTPADVLEATSQPRDESESTSKQNPVSQPRDESESTSKQNPTISGVLQPKVAGNEQAKKKRKKADSIESGFANNAGYGYNIPFDPAYYNPFFGGLPWGADPYMYGMPGMPYVGYSTGLYDANAIGNIPPQALGMQAYPASYQSGGPQSRVYQDAAAAAGYSRQAERPRDAGSQRRPSEHSQPSNSTHRAESRSRNRSDSGRQDHTRHRASTDYDEERYSRKRARPSPRGDYASRRPTYEDSGDEEERNFKRRWGCRSQVTVDTRS